MRCRPRRKRYPSQRRLQRPTSQSAQVIEEWKLYGKLTGDPEDSEFAAALEQGFRSAGWKGALTQAIATMQNRRGTSYYSPLMIARFYADLGDTEQAFQWLDTA